VTELQTMRGIYPALLTPFDKRNKINFPALRRLIDFNIAKGVTGFYVNGSTSEVFLLSHAERLALMEAVAEHVNGRVRLIAHVGAISTDEAVDFAKHACALGVDAVSSVAPFYYHFSLAEITRYYFDIADASAAPVLVYNIPAFSGVNMTMESIAELLSDERILGVKHTSNDFYLLERIKHDFPDRIVFNGYDEMFVSGLAAGADGAIGSTFNVMAEKYIRIRDLFGVGDIAKAQAEQTRANNIISAMVKTGGVQAAEKALLDLLGVPMGECRKPFKTLSEQEKKALYDVYRQNC